MNAPPDSVFEPHPSVFRLNGRRLALLCLLGAGLCLLFAEPAGQMSMDDRLSLNGDGVRMFQQRRFVKGIRPMDIGFDGNGRCLWISASVLSVGNRPVLRLEDSIGRATGLLGQPEIVDHDSLGAEYIYSVPPYRVCCWLRSGRISSLVLSR